MDEEIGTSLQDTIPFTVEFDVPDSESRNDHTVEFYLAGYDIQRDDEEEEEESESSSQWCGVVG